ncbi:MAG: DUF222 domain-containing protein [Microbacteriaceae bacterium]
MSTNLELATSTLHEGLALYAAALREIPIGPTGERAAQNRLEELIRQAVSTLQSHESIVARIAGRIATQCEPVLGLNSMSTSYGHSSAASLIADLCKTSYSEAARLVQNGIMLLDAESADVERDSSAQNSQHIGNYRVAEALSEGRLSPAQAHEVSKALNKTNKFLNPEEQAQLAATLVDVGEDMTVSGLKNYAEKRVLEASVLTPLELEQQIRERRFLSIGRMENGLYPLRGLLDPESAALVKAVCDDASNPNKPSFNAVEEHTGIIDTRTTGQRHLDRLLELLEAGIGVNPNDIYSGKRPAVKMIVREHDLASDNAQAWFEGIDTPVSKHTAERIICTSGTQRVVTDASGIPLYLGRESRTFTQAQKQALTIRDGGCLWPECDRPPAWCEAHHITEWENGGHTNLDNGILLCRQHHMELHHYAWRIEPIPRSATKISRDVRPDNDVMNQSPKSSETQKGMVDTRALFTLHPPPNHPRYRGPRPMPSKAPWHATQELILSG